MRFARHLVPLGIMWGVAALIVFVATRFGLRMTQLTKDPVGLLGGPDVFYYGMLSHLGVLLWCAAAAISLCASLVLPKEDFSEARGYLRLVGFLTVALCIDDLFMVHEDVAPAYFGIPENLVQVLYAACLASIVFRYRRFIVEQTEYGLLAMAGGFFALSMTIDIVPIVDIGSDFEDGFKTVGIITYFYYCVLTSGYLLKTAASPHYS
jgi:hypothetical protein